jgi:hypothetical protein
MLSTLTDWGEQWAGMELAPIALVELEDCLLGLARFTARGRVSGIEMDVEYAQLLTLGGGLVSRREGRATSIHPVLLGHGPEEAVGLLVRERDQRQLLVPVKLGDDPRRPRAEPSAAGVEKDFSGICVALDFPGRGGDDAARQPRHAPTASG